MPKPVVHPPLSSFLVPPSPAVRSAWSRHKLVHRCHIHLRTEYVIITVQPLDLWLLSTRVPLLVSSCVHLQHCSALATTFRLKSVRCYYSESAPLPLDPMQLSHGTVAGTCYTGSSDGNKCVILLLLCFELRLLVGLSIE